MNKKIYEYTEDMIQYKVSLGYDRRSYEGYLLDFTRFLQIHYPNTDYLTEEIALDWCRQRRTESPSGFHRRAMALREFTKYLFSIEKSSYILPTNYTAKQTRYTPYIFTDKELSNIFKASDHVIPHPNSPCREIVVPVLYRLIYFCGLRPNEGREILKKDVDLNEGVLLIRKNKSHRERRIPMSEDITEMCREYKKRIDLLYPHSPFFFPSPDGNAYSAKWLTGQFLRLWNSIKPLENTHKVRVYDLRHRYATAIMMKWFEEGNDLYAMLPYLSAYMGHAKFSDTAYYIHLLPEKLVHTASIDWPHFSSLIPEVD